jgi:hypothetical protein
MGCTLQIMWSAQCVRMGRSQVLCTRRARRVQSGRRGSVACAIRVWTRRWTRSGTECTRQTGSSAWLVQTDSSRTWHTPRVKTVRPGQPVQTACAIDVLQGSSRARTGQSAPSVMTRTPSTRPTAGGRVRQAQSVLHATPDGRRRQTTRSVTSVRRASSATQACRVRTARQERSRT